jgi:hypothetical protein
VREYPPPGMSKLIDWLKAVSVLIDQSRTR